MGTQHADAAGGDGGAGLDPLLPGRRGAVDAELVFGGGVEAQPAITQGPQGTDGGVVSTGLGALVLGIDHLVANRETPRGGGGGGVTDGHRPTAQHLAIVDKADGALAQIQTDFTGAGVSSGRGSRHRRHRRSRGAAGPARDRTGLDRTGLNRSGLNRSGRCRTSRLLGTGGGGAGRRHGRQGRRRLQGQGGPGTKGDRRSHQAAGAQTPGQAPGSPGMGWANGWAAGIGAHGLVAERVDRERPRRVRWEGSGGDQPTNLGSMVEV